MAFWRESIQVTSLAKGPRFVMAEMLSLLRGGKNSKSQLAKKNSFDIFFSRFVWLCLVAKMLPVYREQNSKVVSTLFSLLKIIVELTFENYFGCAL